MLPCSTQVPQALTALMPDLMKLARRLTGNADEAQDLCQEVMLKLWCRIHAGEQIDNLRAYAMTALRNQFRQSLRDRTPNTTLDETQHVIPPDVFACLALEETASAISRLPANQALLMKLVATGETSPRALAQTTGWPVGTVMSRLARARAQLRAEMGLANRAPVSALL